MMQRLIDNLQTSFPISTATVALLTEIRKTTNSNFLFPQEENPEAHTVDIKKFWASLLKRAEISNFRVHDLRHNFASVLVSKGLSLPIIGQLLGHTQTATTARYAHLMTDPLREATNKAAEEMGFKPETKEKENDD